MTLWMHDFYSDLLSVWQRIRLMMIEEKSQGVLRHKPTYTTGFPGSYATRLSHLPSFRLTCRSEIETEYSRHKPPDDFIVIVRLAALRIFNAF